MTGMQGMARDCLIEDGQLIRIAYHLHKHCFSIRDAGTRRVIGYADRIIIRNARFIVSQCGRTRVLRDRRKNVHAFVQGEYWSELQRLRLEDAKYREAYYNPYRTVTFVDRSTFEPLNDAQVVLCDQKKVYYW